MSVEPEAMANPHLPPEILQMVFRNLGSYKRGWMNDGFFDLMRCKRVCKTWAACLPGNDPDLSRMLFLKNDLASKGEDKSSDEAYDEQFSDEVSLLEVLPLIIIKVKVPVVSHGEEDDSLPGLAFHLDFRFHSIRRIRLLADGTTFHPMVEGLNGFMHLVHPDFSGLYGDIDPEQTLAFHTLEELERKTCLPRDHQYNDGSWKNMMLCEPALEKIGVRFDWSTYCCRRLLKLDGHGKGITTGQFAATIRRFLAGAEKDVKCIANELRARCECVGDITRALDRSSTWSYSSHASEETSSEEDN